MPGPWKWTFQPKQVTSAPWHLDGNLSRDSKPDLPSKAAPKSTETAREHRRFSSLTLLREASFLRQLDTSPGVPCSPRRQPETKGRSPSSGSAGNPWEAPDDTRASGEDLREESPRQRSPGAVPPRGARVPPQASAPIRLMRELGREAQTPWRSLGHSPQVRCGVYFSPAALATEALAGVPGGMYEKGQSSAVNRSKYTRNDPAFTDRRVAQQKRRGRREGLHRTERRALPCTPPGQMPDLPPRETARTGE